jgi:glutamyl-tRNA synthetase
LAEALELPIVEYAHVPLVLGPDGARLAKRHGSVTLAELTGAGVSIERVLRWIATSAGLSAPETLRGAVDLLPTFAPGDVNSAPTTLDTTQAHCGI